MDWKDIDGLRDPGFAVVRRGYDRREVDRVLASLVDWLETDAAKDIGELAIKRKLEFVGKSTARILLTTEEESELMGRHARKECEELQAQAEATALKTRQAADDAARQVRAKAEENARETGEAATAKARQIVEEGDRRRAQIEAEVSELEARRDAALGDLDRLRAELGSTLTAHKPGARPADARDGGSPRTVRRPGSAKRGGTAEGADGPTRAETTTRADGGKGIPAATPGNGAKGASAAKPADAVAKA